MGGASHRVASLTISFRMEVEMRRVNCVAERSTDAKSFSVRWPVVAEVSTTYKQLTKKIHFHDVVQISRIKVEIKYSAICF